MLTMSNEVYNLLLQAFDVGVNDINSMLNPPPKEDLGNLQSTQINSKIATLHYRILLAEIVSTKLCFMWFITHPSSLRKSSLTEMAKREPLHKVPMATVNGLQIPYTVIRYPVSMEVRIRRPSGPKVC